MAEKNGAARKPRADAGRNRQHLIDVARAAFATHGAAATLKDIAANAGVGIGTLYRHFPTREALLDEVYIAESRALSAEAERLRVDCPPLDAIAQWLRRFVAFLDNRQIMADVLQMRESDGGRFCTASGDALEETLSMLLARARDAGALTANIAAVDMLTAISGVASYSAESDWRASAERLVELMVAGMKLPG